MQLSSMLISRSFVSNWSDTDGHYHKLFGLIQEFPSIRFRAAKPGENGTTDIQALVAQRIAVNVDERLSTLQRTGQVPSLETCELVIADR